MQRFDSLKVSNFSGKSSDDGKSIVESETDAKSTSGQDSFSNNTSDKPLVVETKEDHGHPLNNSHFSSPPLLLQEDRNFVAEAIPVKGVDKVREAKFPIDVGSQLKTVIKGRCELNSMSGNSTSNDLKTGSSMASDGSSDSDMESGSTSDSESEHEREERRKKRERILAERAAAKAINAIKEKENIVAKLEGEKESLEKILEERAKQQAQEVILSLFF